MGCFVIVFSLDLSVNVDFNYLLTKFGGSDLV